MTDIQWTLQEVSISKLKANARNPRYIDKDQAAHLSDLIDKFGLIDKPIVNADYQIIGGHQRIKILQKKKIKKVEVWYPSRQLDEKEIDHLTIGLNKNQGNWDFDILANEWDIDALLEYGFTAEDLDLGEIKTSEEPAEDEYDEPLKDQPRSKIGDIYDLGPHRIICGSSTDRETIEKVLDGKVIDLVVTDPPYNVDYKGGRGKKRNEILNDKMGNTEFGEFLFKFYSNAFEFMKAGASIYVFHSDLEAENFLKYLKLSGLNLKRCLVWVKNHFILGRSDYHSKHEPCLYGKKEGGENSWNSDRKQTTVLEFDKPNSSEIHPTMKPVLLMSKLIENSSKEGELVFDFFLGSGSTLIAAEQIGRICYGCELDPRYCDAIVDRYKKYKMERNQESIILLNGELYD